MWLEEGCFDRSVLFLTEHNSRARGEDPTMLPRPAYENTGITVVSQEELDLDLNQTEIYTSPNKNCEKSQKKDRENRILTFDSDLELSEICKKRRAL